MKVIKCFAVAICPLFFVFVGCDLRRPTLQPTLQPSYVDQGGTMVWSATGRPFQIYWVDKESPCLASDSLESDGRNDVVCHAFDVSGSYQYYVDAPSSTKAPPIPLTMHVGTCGGCSIIINKKPSKIGDNVPSPSVGGEVDISCDPTNGPTTVKPSGGPTGLKIGSDVVFYFRGNYVPGITPMTVTFAPADCANNPTPGQNFVIQGISGHCQVNKSPTISYTATANLCSVSQATLSVSASR